MTAQKSNSNPSSSDQRYFPRWDVENDVYLHSDNEAAPFHAKTKDLNCAGVCINTPHAFEPKQQVYMSIQLAPNKIVKAHGTVMWVRPQTNSQNRVGILFDGLNDQDKDMIFDQAFTIKPDEIVNRWFSGWDK